MRTVTIGCLALLVGASAYAQDEAARKAAMEVAARVPLEKPIKGAPYSAETIVEGVQTLADGNRIVRKTSGRVYRDSEGRSRREEDRPVSFNVRNGAATNLMTTISIVDPVAGFAYSLNPETKVAWKTPIGTSDNVMAKIEQMQVELKAKLDAVTKAQAEGQSPADADKEKLAAAEKERIARARRAAPGVREGHSPGPLEHKTLEGVAVEGRKTTTVIPAGEVGNEQPLTVISEEWRSPELNVLVMTRHSDPRTGDSSYRLTNIIRAEPDRSLFMVPPDYTIRETGIRRYEQR